MSKAALPGSQSWYHTTPTVLKQNSDAKLQDAQTPNYVPI